MAGRPMTDLMRACLQRPPTVASSVLRVLGFLLMPFSVPPMIWGLGYFRTCQREPADWQLLLLFLGVLLFFLGLLLFRSPSR
jgi:hypothetical protein